MLSYLKDYEVIFRAKTMMKRKKKIATVCIFLNLFNNLLISPLSVSNLILGR